MSSDGAAPGSRQRAVAPVVVIIDVARFEALIFDLDGVITQTASLHARAWKRMFDEFLGRQTAQVHGTFTPFDLEADYRRYVDGKPRIAGATSFLAARGIDVPTGAPGDHAEQGTAHGLAGLKDRYFAELLASEGVRAFEPAVALLQEARGHGLRLAVASSSHHCADILRAGGLTDFFDARVDGIDIDRLGLKGKPAPDMFLEAARRLGVAPPRAAVFEDATAGVAAGRAGGFGLVVGVGSGAQAAALLRDGANEVVSDLGKVSLRSNT
jgi:beta-phosphoglucomutase family hydrolase